MKEMQKLSFKRRWKALYGELPAPEAVEEYLLTPEEVAARAGVKVTHVTGKYMNVIAGPSLKPDAYAEGDGWNMVYFTLTNVNEFLEQKKKNVARARADWVSDRGRRATPSYV